MRSRTVYRLLFATAVVGSLVVLAGGYLASAEERDATELARQATLDPSDRTAVAPPRENVTVITTDSNTLTDQGSGPRAEAEIVALNPNGTVQYYDDSYSVYWDVDPSPEGAMTVTYTASEYLEASECNAKTSCTRNVIERVNLTTGERELLYSKITPGVHVTRWHDVDRIDEDHFVVADIDRNRVFVVNTTSEIGTWEWDALSEYEPESGGEYPEDWTHVNDVELLEDGRIMASLRNQDQVVFLDRESGLVENWTLGSEDDYDTLYEQHNPDFIPGERGGPAVVVADSENNRVVEYQRENSGERTNGSRASSDSSDGEWNQTWTWADTALQWPRDADRLPDGNTLVADSNGNRVLEVNREGEVVWEFEIGFPYEAERLGTGDESAGGESARELGLDSRSVTSGPGEGDQPTSPVGRLTALVKQVVPGRLLNGVMYVTPVWMDVDELLALLVGTVGGLVWVGAELRWSARSLRLRSPFVVRRK